MQVMQLGLHGWQDVPIRQQPYWQALHVRLSVHCWQPVPQPKHAAVSRQYPYTQSQQSVAVVQLRHGATQAVHVMLSRQNPLSQLVQVYPTAGVKLQTRQPRGQGPHVLLPVMKYPLAHVVQIQAEEHTEQPLGQPMQTPLTVRVLGLHCKHCRDQEQMRQFWGHCRHRPVREDRAQPGWHCEHRFQSQHWRQPGGHSRQVCRLGLKQGAAMVQGWERAVSSRARGSSRAFSIL